MHYLVFPLLLIWLVLSDISVDSKAEREMSEMANRIAIIEQAENSSNPAIIKAAENAQKEIEAINSEKEKKQIKEAAYNDLEPYQRPVTWLVILFAIGGMVLVYYMNMKYKRLY